MPTVRTPAIPTLPTPGFRLPEVAVLNHVGEPSFEITKSETDGHKNARVEMRDSVNDFRAVVTIKIDEFGKSTAAVSLDCAMPRDVLSAWVENASRFAAALPGQSGRSGTLGAFLRRTPPRPGSRLEINMNLQSDTRNGQLSGTFSGGVGSAPKTTVTLSGRRLANGANASVAIAPQGVLAGFAADGKLTAGFNGGSFSDVLGGISFKGAALGAEGRSMTLNVPLQRNVLNRPVVKVQAPNVGTLVIPHMPQNVYAFGAKIDNAIHTAIDTAIAHNVFLAASTASCILSVLKLAGASLICYMLIIASIPVDGPTAGAASIVAVIACFGSKALAVIDMIKAHV